MSRGLMERLYVHLLDVQCRLLQTMSRGSKSRLWCMGLAVCDLGTILRGAIVSENRIDLVPIVTSNVNARLIVTSNVNARLVGL